MPMLNKKSVDDINVKGKGWKDHRREPSGSSTSYYQKTD